VSSCGRVEDGATVLEVVFIAKKQDEDHQITWKNRFLLLEFWVTGLKKIQVLLVDDMTPSLLWVQAYCGDFLTFFSFFSLFADFYNWNRVKVRYCDGASFTGDSEDKVCQIICPFLLLVFTYHANVLLVRKSKWVENIIKAAICYFLNLQPSWWLHTVVLVHFLILAYFIFLLLHILDVLAILFLPFLIWRVSGGKWHKSNTLLFSWG